MQFKIEKGVVLPDSQRGVKPGSIYDSLPLENMEVGDSIFLEEADQEGIKTSIGRVYAKVRLIIIRKSREDKIPEEVKFRISAIDHRTLKNKMEIRIWRVV